jgi:ATP-dependent Clp protease ATP-binding subunit ClpC
MAEEGKLDPVVGREKEIERVCFEPNENNPLIGEPGLENPLLEGLACRIIQKKVSNPV